MPKYTKKTLTGKVTGIFYNEMEEDDYGNTIRPVVSLDRKYKVTLGGRKDENLKVQVGDKWVAIRAGDQLTINTQMAKNEKGTVYYAKVKDITLNSSGSASSSSSSKKSFSKGSSGGGADECQAGITAGHAVNNAVNYCIFKKKELTVENITEYAKVVAQATTELRQALVDGTAYKAKHSEDNPVDEFNSDEEEEPEEEEDFEDLNAESPF